MATSAKNALRERVWAALWIDGVNGVRKGSAVLGRERRPDEWVDDATAIEVLEDSSARCGWTWRWGDEEVEVHIRGDQVPG